MKRIFTSQRFAKGTVAIALAAGIGVNATAQERKVAHIPESLPVAMLNDFSNTHYDTADGISGVIGEVELVRERYADGKTRIERQVALDGEGNYVNHGSWKMYSTAGDVIAEGQYNFGERIGLWTRWCGRNDAPLLGEFPFNNFKVPFMSQAHFADGKMDGDWTITDSSERKCLSVALKAGRRSGPTVIYLPNGKVHSQATYADSIPTGDVTEVNKAGELKRTATYVDGRKIITDVEYYPGSHNKQKKSEMMYLAAKSVAESPDDFWNIRLAKFTADGQDLRHGTAKTWHRNGKPQMEGFYRQGKKSGTFSYWHENGQVSSTGEYRDGETQGNWIWWHENGQKSSVGHYEAGTMIGEWRSWDKDGKLTKQQTRDGSEAVTKEMESASQDLSKKSSKTRTSRH